MTQLELFDESELKYCFSLTLLSLEKICILSFKKLEIERYDYFIALLSHLTDVYRKSYRNIRLG